MQLGRGKKQILDDYDERLRALLAAIDDPKLQSDIVDLRIILADEIKPAFIRAEPTSEMRQRSLEEQLRELRARLDAHEPILSKVAQMFAQSR